MSRVAAGGNPIYQAFNFMDTGGSGQVTKAQLVDAFYALGVGLADDVLGQIMEQWGRGEGDKVINYHDLLGAMFPEIGKQI